MTLRPHNVRLVEEHQHLLCLSDVLCTLTRCCCFVACDVEGLFEKKEIPRDEIDAKNLQKSPLTLQIEEMKDEEHNPFSQYARYDGKVKVTLSIT